jgi:hypothetical protein
MKKTVFTLGKVLNKKEQKFVFGGTGDCDLPENLSTLCPGAVVINPITCLWWCEE